ncbi:hypothetical protein [Actinomadura sp. 6K520]|uniref:hypothetical protein n=1 Tax=Actinomadura sp. 6K520 TaxID=2530364 RepID=UPI00104768A0|nr:hypothetical protein [Actinomadura sp. 6K520]TDE36420.1 hypothetical protein E1289_05960 [Actinomadura sp. 6K520]
MGIFGNKEQINLSDPGEVAIAEHVASVIPDAGEYLLNLLGDFCNEQMYARLKVDVDSRRAPNGWVVPAKLTDVPPIGRKQTPMTFLNFFMGMRGTIALTVWGTSANRGKDYRALADVLSSILHDQGHAAAATWAIVARPEARPSLSPSHLAGALLDGWREDHQHLRNKDVIRAFRNWNK